MAGEWKSCSVTSSLVYDANFKVTATFWAREKSTNVAGNYSTVEWELDVVGASTSGYSWEGATRYHAGWADCYIGNDWNVANPYIGIPKGFVNGTQIIKQTGTTNIGHNADGSLGNLTIWVKIHTSDDDAGHTSNIVWSETGWATDTISFTTIPRASTPSLSGTAVAGKAVTVNTNRASSSFTHTLTYKFGSASGNIGSNVGSSVSWTPPIDLMAQIPNSKTGTGTITCDTYDGNTKIGTKAINFTLNQPSDAAPTMESKWEETGLMSDGVTTLASKGVDATTVIGQLSVKTITISCETKYSSTVKSISCTHNGTTQTSSSSPATFSFEAPVDTGDGKSYFQWTVTDSRGNTVTDSISMAFTPYAKPIVASIVATRTSSVSDTGTITITGTFFNGNVGDIANDVTVTYRYLDTDHSLPTLVKDGQNWSGADGISGVSPDAAYTFTATVTDSFGYSSSKSITLGKAVATLWVGKETVRIHNNLFVGEKSLLDLTYPVGSIYISTNQVSPATLFGGTWKQLKDVFLLASGDAYEAGSTGGEAEHTLTIDELPRHRHATSNSYANGYSNDQIDNKNYSTPVIGKDTADNYENPATATSSGVKMFGGYTGKSKAHNNMPPYLTVYMWQRTA